VLALLLALSLPALASAGDGVIEINQARALAGGVGGDLVSDPPGFPVRISRPGSYRLTSDLSVPLAPGGIVIAPGVDDVTIDLGGFTLRGVSDVIVAPPSWSCGTAFGGIGIRALPSVAPPSARNVVLRNGRVIGFGNAGIDLSGENASVEGVHARQNCGTGISVGDHARIEASHASRNQVLGIACGVACRITNSGADTNGAGGIRPLSESIVAACVANENGGGADIRGFESTLVVDSVVQGTGSRALQIDTGSLVLGVAVRAPSVATLSGTAAKAFGLITLHGDVGSSITGQPLACYTLNGTLSCP